MFPRLCECADPAAAAAYRRRHQERKLSVLRFWRDGLERQLAALDAAISTLQRQMDRDAEQTPAP
jgi:hypothetical protein